jgi:demethylmenaquinone methyltransferase/2-methoxy-6-polyprenyl-1,4-benzoquinol methylase
VARIRKAYTWWYDHVHSLYYNLLMKWCFFPFGGEKRFREKMASGVALSPEERILDMCCGTGRATDALLRKAGPGSRIIGLDLSVGQLRVARRSPELGRVAFMKADASRTPFPDSVFDKVFVTHAIHEMPRRLRLEVLSEARRILRDSGRVVILELDRPGSFWLRLFYGFWFFYWLPFNFETPTRKDMLRHGVAEEAREAEFEQVRKETRFRGVFQVVEGVKHVARETAPLPDSRL